MDIVVFDKNCLVGLKRNISYLARPSDLLPIPGRQEELKALKPNNKLCFVGNEHSLEVYPTLARNFPVGAYFYREGAYSRVINKILYPKEVRLTFEVSTRPDHLYLKLNQEVQFQWRSQKELIEEYQYILSLFPELDFAIFSGNFKACIVRKDVVMESSQDWNYTLPNPGLLWLANEEAGQTNQCIFVTNEPAYTQNIESEGFHVRLPSELKPFSRSGSSVLKNRSI
jgi:hypothetical protein